MTGPKLVAEDGSIIFEFESDAQMRSLLFQTISQAKHGRELRLRFLTNEALNALADAIREHGLAAGDRSFAPMPKAIEDQVEWKPSPEVGATILREIFDNAPDLNWWELGETEKLDLVEKAFLPYRLGPEDLKDNVDTIDHWIARFRR